ncbi:MAG: EamA family transporter [Sphingobacteriia bacterium]|nr:EamA family transporter [Sphingobacteriia bacterium]
MTRYKYIIFTALSGLLYGSIGYFGHHIRNTGMSISDMLFWRFIISSLLIIPFIVKINFKNYKPSDMLGCFIMGMIFYGISTWYYFYSAHEIGSGLAMVLFYAYPAIVALISVFFGKEKISGIEILSLISIFIGCVLISGKFNDSLNAVGIRAGLISAFLYSLYMFFSKKYVNKLDSYLASFLVCLGIGFAFFLNNMIFEQKIDFPDNNSQWLLVIAFALVGTILPIVFLFIGMKGISATKASIISVLEPVTTLIIGITLLNESVTVIQFIGSIIILIGATLVAVNPQISTLGKNDVK